MKRATTSLPFRSPYRHGFVRAAVGLPIVALAEPEENAARHLRLARQASDRGCALVVFPELGLSGYSNEDLFHQRALLDACRRALETLIDASAELTPLILVGLPWLRRGALYNCAAAIHRGRLLAIVPKTYLPGYREYYEPRQFTPAPVDTGSANGGVCASSAADGEPVFGSCLLVAENVPGFRVFAEICEDLWTPLPPSSLGALAGATLLCNLSASSATVGKADYRRLLCASQSGRCVGAYLYAGAGYGESTTELAWDGQGLIFENGALLADGERYQHEGQLLVADVDVDRLDLERMRLNSFQLAAARHAEAIRALPRVRFELELPQEELDLERPLERFPYVPATAEGRHERCREVYRIQVQGISRRLEATGLERLVIGVSGGLDSTQALLVAVRACEQLGLGRRNVLAYTLPGLGTSEKTLQSARGLMSALGVSSHEIDISEASRAMLERLGHPAAKGEPVYDTTFENVQAGERTSLLFRLANQHQALLLGTGDLSELALGWCTYGVGDQMSHYNVNASVPKTLIRFLIGWIVARGELGAEASSVLRAILGTEISPELVPGDGKAPGQRSEDTVGPFELQDFHLYHLSRFGFLPSKVAYLAACAWEDATGGVWPQGWPSDQRRQYELAEIVDWLEVFLDRFFRFSQFKRSAMPNAPKVGSGGSLSPRGDWRAPSDVSARTWLDELRALRAELDL